MRIDLREIGALGPNGAVLADDGGGGEVVALDFAEQVVVDVGLPRHDSDLSGFLFLLSSSFLLY